MTNFNPQHSNRKPGARRPYQAPSLTLPTADGLSPEGKYLDRMTEYMLYGSPVGPS